MRYFGPNNPLGLTNWLKGYIHYTRMSESPLPFHFWTGVSTIAGALRRQVWIDERHFQWTPNFYIFLVGPPGVVAKSTSINPGMRLLERLKVPFGPPSMTWQALTESLQEAIYEREYFDVHTKRTHKLTMSAITIPVSELGTFLRLDDPAFVDVLIDLWDSRIGEWGHRTKTAGDIRIKNPWLNIIGCTTPAWMQANVPEKMIGGGLMSRVVFVYADQKRRLVAYPSEEVSTADHADIENHLFTDLCEIASLAGEYKRTAAATKWGTEWYAEHHDPAKRPVHLASDRYSGYLARKQTHIHKLAMVLAAAEGSDLLLDERHLSTAAQIITSVEPDMQKAFESIGVVDEARRTKEIVNYVRYYRKITTAELWALCSRNMQMRDFRETITAAVSGGQIMSCQWIDAKRGPLNGFTVPLPGGSSPAAATTPPVPPSHPPGTAD